ncbi:UDP-glycosyltransferase 74F2-like [Olea europaea subsp. europaea]|uniref:UDP-glycosyltransferase 74F2-like n=1 Tax=Olea europaea subsp. europaea TaxID=158383 RepID=A0A8S0SZ49_OLEEU|nr:UDP-glycosyltransferase 74F2-like [Olea europaea subsp. europaea]
MDKEKKGRILAVPFPSHGHINPMMQLCKRLVCKGLKATLTLTKFYGKKNMKEKSGLIQIETISDGDDEYDIFDRQSVPDSVVRFTKHGSESIAQLIEKYESLGDPIVGVIYDSLLPWVVEVPKKFGLVAIEFFTQHSGVNLVEYHYYHKLIPYPVESPVTIPGLPLLQPEDVPSYGVYLGNFTLMASQFSTVDKADFAVVNTFYKMEEEIQKTFNNIKITILCGFVTILVLRGTTGLGSLVSFETGVENQHLIEETNWILAEIRSDKDPTDPYEKIRASFIGDDEDIDVGDDVGVAVS